MRKIYKNVESPVCFYEENFIPGRYIIYRTHDMLVLGYFNSSTEFVLFSEKQACHLNLLKAIMEWIEIIQSENNERHNIDTDKA